MLLPSMVDSILRWGPRRPEATTRIRAGSSRKKAATAWTGSRSDVARFASLTDAVIRTAGRRLTAWPSGDRGLGLRVHVDLTGSEPGLEASLSIRGIADSFRPFPAHHLLERLRSDRHRTSDPEYVSRVVAYQPTNPLVGEAHVDDLVGQLGLEEQLQLLVAPRPHLLDHRGHGVETTGLEGAVLDVEPADQAVRLRMMRYWKLSTGYCPTCPRAARAGAGTS